MKAIVPVAGIGSRLRPHTHTQPKALIPVAGKPIIAHITDLLIQNGINEVIYIIGYLGDKIENYIRRSYPGLRCEFIVQTKALGVGYALWLTRDLIKEDDELFIVFGDTIFETDLKKVFARKISALGVKKVNNPGHFGVAEVDHEGNILKLVEKPGIPKSNLALIGAYYITEGKLLMEVLDRRIKGDPSSTGEYNLTDALMQMVNEGHRMQVFDVDTWFDCGKKDILLETNATLLRKGQYQQPNLELYKDSIIIPPVYIAEGCQIKACIIGPNVSIGEQAIIEHSVIKNSIIGPHAHIAYTILDESLIGNDAYLKGLVQSLNLGDSTEINYSS